MSQAIEPSTEVAELSSLLRVNLTEGTVETEEIPTEYRDRFISGKGLGAAMLLDEVPAGTDPLSPENTLYFMFGPLSGFAPGTSRYGAITKSPLTGGYVDSYSGGHFPAMFRFALPQYLGIAIEGEAEEPVYLDVTDDGVELKDATDLWGLDTKETAAEFDGKFTKTACIGPAGENEVRFATITSDEGTHHAGRGGVGAVMGSKNLKAVVATAQDPPNPDNIRGLKAQHTKRLGTSEDVSWARNGGTQLIPEWTQSVGALPSHNWTKGTVEDVDDISIDAFSVGHVGTDSCYGCPVACGHITDFADVDIDGAFPEARVEWGPEYETIGMVGANTDITDVTAITELSDRADTLGMDTITLGNVLSFTMECVEAGIVDYEMDWGDAHAAAELVTDIAHRDGELAEMLGEGSQKAAEALDDERALEASVNVKGMELPAYDPRASYGMALAYATSDRGGCHQRAWPIGSDALGGDREPFAYDDHAAVVVDEQDENALTFSAVACDFTAYDYEKVCEWLNELGYDVDVETLETVGERAWNMTRLFNAREGFDRDDDELPGRLTKPLEAGGPADGNAISEEGFQEMLDEYYQLRGWTAEGVPTEQTVERLDIDDWAEHAA
ncbi:aldehyde ferredoxin oxidoreductase family protein [Halolamina sp.]|jgi:aldehyde:ferredoxin oxidoreductase|uniref:aldehyde ferredoxin oxidoreductase family protein n=1 Tax=Halolamina sp. TaxID=1940283 RepID=UPI000223BCCA|nr:Aldehyde ferredoxin oxidoreductase [halophilic archaeon DL31]